jgi:two-component system LytT family sensor kinase
MTVPPDSSRLRLAFVIVGAWLLVSLMFLPQSLLLNASRPQPAPWFDATLGNLAIFALWALLTPLVLWLAGRLPLDRGRRLRAWCAHLALALAMSTLHVALMSLLVWPSLPDGVPFAALMINHGIGLGATNVLLYFGVLAAAHARAYLQRYRDGERARAQAELAALRAQLHPHFLFNALNALGELVHRDAALAEHLILKLSNLLRRVLGRGTAEFVPLAEEIAFTEAYLDIQRALMDARLRTAIDVPDALLTLPVPGMLLQPLIENAIRHGLAPRRDGGVLRIEARRERGMLRLVVDNDAGVVTTPGEGIGLANVRARLRVLYGDAARLDIEPGAQSFRVVIELPIREDDHG